MWKYIKKYSFYVYVLLVGIYSYHSNNMTIGVFLLYLSLLFLVTLNDINNIISKDIIEIQQKYIDTLKEVDNANVNYINACQDTIAKLMTKSLEQQKSIDSYKNIYGEL